MYEIIRECLGSRRFLFIGILVLCILVVGFVNWYCLKRDKKQGRSHP